MSPDYLNLPATVSVGTAIERMAEAHCSEAHLVGEDDKWAGKICLYDLVSQPFDAMCLPLQERTPLILQADDNALFAQTAMRDFIGEGCRCWMAACWLASFMKPICLRMPGW